ncbi:hypothetical protein SS50377_20269 [Spironucleus salmonicida]|uniref:Uncharacterized protein n=1 Tax=Spironucleus salmonicida TaxID=348837 RepID=V6LM79_9EUKA|nr:hypothetical protein SS50377_20269 [Spironucleus salmonicida]|eukprot:EST45323.1 Hypothetical protein SS50377_14900 [Spironucleus salmonicida]
MHVKIPFLMQNQKQISQWGPFVPVYRLTKPLWVYDIKPLHGTAKLQNKDAWQAVICPNQFEINEAQDSYSGVSINRPIRPKQTNYEIQPIELQLNQQDVKQQQLPYNMIDFNNSEMEPIQSYLPISFLRIVYNREEISDSFSHHERTPLPLPPTKIFSALRTRDTPQVAWSVQRPIFESFSFQSPVGEAVLQQDVVDLVKPPKLPKKLQ